MQDLGRQSGQLVPAKPWFFKGWYHSLVILQN
jgi:hypothetical protein